MSFFNRKTTWTNLEFIPFKLYIAAAYILLGAYFQKFVREYYLIFIIVFVLAVIWTLYLWISKMKNGNKII